MCPIPCRTIFGVAPLPECGRRNQVGRIGRSWTNHEQRGSTERTEGKGVPPKCLLGNCGAVRWQNCTRRRICSQSRSHPFCATLEDKSRNLAGCSLSEGGLTQSMASSPAPSSLMTNLSVGHGPGLLAACFPLSPSNPNCRNRK